MGWSILLLLANALTLGISVAKGEEEMTCNPPHIPNGFYAPQRIKHRADDIIIYVCRDGFYPETQKKVVKCTSTGWIPAPRCGLKPCDFPQIKNGRLYDEERYRPYFPVPIGKRFYYLCNSGFVTASREHWDFIHCTVRGWEPAVPCLRQCVFHKVENGESPHRQIPYSQGESAEVKCYPGYSLPNGQDTVTCTENGWSPQPKCIPVRLPCGPPPSIRHGIVSHELDSYQHGEEVTYNCAEGFGIDGPALIKCLGGKWSQPPTCMVTDCDNLPRFENAIPQEEEKYSYRSGEQVTFTCAPSYHMNGSNTVTCVNREWIGEVVCKGACVILEEIMERHNITLRWKERQKLYSLSGDDVEFQCKYGYKQIKTSPPLRTMCVDGHINYPSCSKSHSWFSG